MSQSVRPGNRERGWNDPPEFLHTEDSPATTQAVPNKRTILNQRVAHTFDTTTTNQSSNQAPDAVKPLTAPPLLIPKTSTDSNETTNPSSTPTTPNSASKNAPPNPLTSEISVEYIESALNASVKSLKEGNVSAKICDDVAKRIKIFVNAWPRLNENVKLKMCNMAKALETNQLQTANDVHLRLMMDYPAEVSQWMVGIKRLIHELITLSGPSPTEAKETTEAPASNMFTPITCPLAEPPSTTADATATTISDPAEAVPSSSVQEI